MKNNRKLLIGLLWLLPVVIFSQQKKAERARDIGISFEGKPGKYNAITDVAGIEVGYKTIIEGSGNLVAEKGLSEPALPYTAQRKNKQKLPCILVFFEW